MAKTAASSEVGEIAWKPPRWSLFFRMPEFTGMPWRTRARVHWRANLAMLRSAKIVALSLLISVVPTICLVLVFWRAASEGMRRVVLFGAVPTTLDLILAGVAAAIWLVTQHLAFIYALNRFYAPFVRRELAAMGMPMCPACGQRLVGGSAARCSECGTRLDSIEP